MAVVGWLTWQALSGGESKAKAEESGELPVVSAEVVAMRPRDEPSVSVRSPFPSMATDDASARPELDGGKGGKGGDVAELELPVVVVERRPAFVLRLDSIVGLFGNSGHARINGHDVRLGEPIPDCDPESPPVLVQLGGLSARIEHRGREYDLHLDLMPSLELGGEVIRHELPPGSVVAPGAELSATPDAGLAGMGAVDG